MTTRLSKDLETARYLSDRGFRVALIGGKLSVALRMGDFPAGITILFTPPHVVRLVVGLPVRVASEERAQFALRLAALNQSGLGAAFGLGASGLHFRTQLPLDAEGRVAGDALERAIGLCAAHVSAALPALEKRRRA